MWGVTLSLLFLSRTHTKAKKMENRYRSGDGSFTSPNIMDNNIINSIIISHPNNHTSSINNNKNNNINFYTTNNDNNIDNQQNEPLLRNDILNDVEVAFNNGINNVYSGSGNGYRGTGMFGQAGVPYGSPYIGGGDTPSSSSRSANHSIVHSIIGPSSQRSYSVASHASTHINHTLFIAGMSNGVGVGGGGGVMNKKSLSEYSNNDTIETISNIDDDNDNDENNIGDVDYDADDINVSKQSDNELFGVVYSPENSLSFYYRNSSNSFNHSINPSINTTSTTANNINNKHDNNNQNNSEKSSSIQALDNDNIKSLLSGYNQGHSK